MMRQVFIPKDRDELVRLAEAVLANNARASREVGIKAPAQSMKQLRSVTRPAGRRLAKIHKLEAARDALVETLAPDLRKMQKALRDAAQVIKRLAPDPSVIEHWGFRLSEGGGAPPPAP